jgi:hypothetical protein
VVVVREHGEGVLTPQQVEEGPHESRSVGGERVIQHLGSPSHLHEYGQYDRGVFDFHRDVPLPHAVLEHRKMLASQIGNEKALRSCTDSFIVTVPLAASYATSVERSSSDWPLNTGAVGRSGIVAGLSPAGSAHRDDRDGCGRNRAYACGDPHDVPPEIIYRVRVTCHASWCGKS